MLVSKTIFRRAQPGLIWEREGGRAERRTERALQKLDAPLSGSGSEAHGPKSPEDRSPEQSFCSNEQTKGRREDVRWIRSPGSQQSTRQCKLAFRASCVQLAHNSDSIANYVREGRHVGACDAYLKEEPRKKAECRLRKPLSVSYLPSWS